MKMPLPKYSSIVEIQALRFTSATVGLLGVSMVPFFPDFPQERDGFHASTEIWAVNVAVGVKSSVY